MSCLERAVLSEPRFAPAWSALAVLYLHEHMFGYDPQPDREPALARALEAVRTSLDIDGSGRDCSRHARGHLARERRRRRISTGRGARTRDLPGASRRIVVDWLFARRGRGLAARRTVARRGLPLTPNVPGWANVAYAFRYLQTQDYEQALDWSLRADAPDWYVTSMTVAASAALAGRGDIAQREVRRLLELNPDFERTGREQLGKWHMDAALLTTLLDGLRLAGLQIA